MYVSDVIATQPSDQPSDFRKELILLRLHIPLLVTTFLSTLFTDKHQQFILDVRLLAGGKARR